MNTTLPPEELELVERTTSGDRQAYGQLIAQNQSAVCAVAYSVLGDLASSEDAAQEAFLIAWKDVRRLRERGKFRAWVCGIARKVALAQLRRIRKTEPLPPSGDLPDIQPTAAEEAISREEQALVWQALEALPQTYREPLVLYYREEKSVASVAGALDLSEDAVKQRLARGREMLRAKVAATVENALRTSRPGPVFTAAVLAALPGLLVSSAAAATVGATGKAALPAAKIAATASASSWLLGLLGGLLGPILGTWTTYQSAHFHRQRAYLLRSSCVFAVMFLIFLAPYAALQFGWWRPNRGPDSRLFLMVQLLWMATFYGSLFAWAVVTGRRYRQIFATDTAAGVRPIPETRVRRWFAGWEGRQWRSRASLFGLPLVHVNFVDPADSLSGTTDCNGVRPGVARGWIAVGNVAYGVLFAFGSIAIGSFALGGLSCGLVAIGGLAAGGLSFGGLAMGGLAFGGGALGCGAIGGFAAGWWAVGGGTLAWRGANGGLAWAHDYAVGGQAYALHANDAIANQWIGQHPFFQLADRSLADLLPIISRPWFAPVLLSVSLMLPILMWRVGYRRKNRPSVPPA